MQNKLDWDLGKAIKKARDEKNLTQAQLAETVDLAVSTISKIECGKSKPSLAALRRIIIALDANANDIFGTGTDLCSLTPTTAIRQQINNIQKRFDELKESINMLEEQT